MPDLRLTVANSTRFGWKVNAFMEICAVHTGVEVNERQLFIGFMIPYIRSFIHGIFRLRPCLIRRKLTPALPWHCLYSVRHVDHRRRRSLWHIIGERRVRRRVHRVRKSRP
jgi:hypothetical protein